MSNSYPESRAMDPQDVEDEIVDRQLRFPEVKVTFFSLYRYASKRDYALLVISAACAIIAGACQPLPGVYRLLHSSCLLKLMRFFRLSSLK